MAHRSEIEYDGTQYGIFTEYGVHILSIGYTRVAAWDAATRLVTDRHSTIVGHADSLTDAVTTIHEHRKGTTK